MVGVNLMVAYYAVGKKIGYCRLHLCWQRYRTPPLGKCQEVMLGIFQGIEISITLHMQCFMVGTHIVGRSKGIVIMFIES